MATPPVSARFVFNVNAAPRASSASSLPPLTKDRLIGNGADGKVFLMRDAQGNPFAVKEMILSDTQKRRAEGVKRQIEALQRIPHHEHVIRHYGVHLGTCSLHIVMEYVPGGSISALLSSLGAFHESAVREYARQLCRGLAFLHSHNIVHRDIKGANCLVHNDGRLMIADFGSSVIGQPAANNRGLQGTAHWMSPESIREEVTPQGDIWALACTIIEMATARSPWADARFTNDWAAMFHISQCGRGPPIPAHLSRQAHAFLRACFEQNPDDRPSAAKCLEMPFLCEDFDATANDPGMAPPDREELTPYMSEFPKRDDSPMGTDYASTFSSVSFAPIDPEWGDAEQPNLDSTAMPSESDGGDGSSPPPPINAGAAGSASFPTQKSPVSVKDSPLTPAAPKATPSDIRAFITAAIAGVSLLAPTSGPSAAPSLLTAPGGGGTSLARLEEAELFNILMFLPAQALGRMSGVSTMLHAIIDQDAKERLWRRLFLAIFGEVDIVRATLRKSWKGAYRISLGAAHWAAGQGRYRVRRQLAHSAHVFEALDLQGGAIGSNEAVPCMVKVEPLPRPRSRAAATPTKRGTPSSAHQSPARVGTAAGRSSFHAATTVYAAPASPSKLPAQLPTIHNPPVLPPLDTAPKLPPTQGGRFTFIRPPAASPPVAAQTAGATANPTPPSLRGGVTVAEGMPPLAPTAVGAVMVSPNGSGGFTSGSAAASPLAPVPPLSALPHSRSDTWNELYEFHRTDSMVVPAPKPHRSSGQHQYRVLRHLDAMGVGCIPRPLYQNTEGTDIPGHSVLVTSALGPSLSELLLFSGNQLSLRTVMALALKLMTALADIHDRDVVHGGITPSNIVMGIGANRDKVHFINFNHARFYRDPKTHRNTTNVISSAPGAKRSYEYYCFCSTSVQRGCTPSPRDDIVALGYVLCYLTHGGLPWSADDTHLDGEKLIRAKAQYLEALSSTPPLQLHHFLKSGYSLKQGDTPDYVFLCSLVKKMMRERGWSPDAPLDWHHRASLMTGQ
jgi:serine/threonine protein kinase